MGFNRMARALRIIAARLFRLVVTNFFDDFTQIEVEPPCKSAQKTLEDLMSLLGWGVAQEEKKRKPFQEKFEPLGVVRDLAETTLNSVQVSNKPNRLEEVAATLREHLEEGTMTRRQTESLRGRMQFLGQHAYGRIGALATRGLTATARAERDKSMRWLLDKVTSMRPRSIDFGQAARPVIVSTDGAVEASGATCGGVIIDGDFKQAFGDVIHPGQVAKWNEVTTSSQCIGKAELLPVLWATRLWARRVYGRRVVFFVDNESARYALMNMYSPVNASTSRLWDDVLTEDDTSGAINWYARVVSESNIADAPSRLDFGPLQSRGFEIIPVTEEVAGKWTLQK